MLNAHSEHILPILKSLPEKPGVYRFFDVSETIIYVGKAKNLKRRVSSYFNKKQDSPKVRLLVSKIADIQTTVVDSEWEALLLENNMIKEFKPRYNILLKDDKSYPWIAVSKEPFPRLFSTRHPDKNRMQLFGPYASVHYMNVLLETVNEMFPLRTCRHLVKSDRPCMQFQIKKCSAPCAGLISQAEYQQNIDTIIAIIKGYNSIVIQQLTDKMMQYAAAWEFEKAELVKQKIAVLKNFIGKSVVVNPAITKVDVFSIEEEENSAYINYLHVEEGAIVQSYTFEIANKIDQTKEELLWTAILEVMDKFGTLSATIFVPFIPIVQREGFNFFVPQRGEKKKLLDLSEKNVRFYMLEKKKRIDLIDPERHRKRVLDSLQKALGMKQLPVHIECFDNSNTQGEEPVAAMVCFMNGKPAKKEYRHFIIKTVVGADDFASMEEVVKRRYSRLLDEKKSLPDLVVIDGGKGQLHAAYKALSDLGIADEVMVVGIAKRLEDIYKVGDELPVYLDKKSEAQKLLQQLRDEVHRFGITHHRVRRAKKSIASSLDVIPGIGKCYKERLLKEFKSVKRVENASEEQLAKIVGRVRAHNLKTFFTEQNLQADNQNEWKHDD